MNKHELALQPVRSEEFMRERVAMIESEAARKKRMHWLLSVCSKIETLM
jgi:hypothetical protein